MRHRAACLPAILAALVGGDAMAQRVPSVAGTYALGTRARPSPSRDGCWLEAARVASDSLRVQIRCTMPAPGHHIGVLDARLPFHAGAAVYHASDAAGHCRIAVRFAAATAVVTQDGSDQACGFGAFVNVAGTYNRISRRMPPFDLAPVERPARGRTGP